MNKINNERNFLGLYTNLSNEVNILKERLNKLDKSDKSDKTGKDSQAEDISEQYPTVFVTDVYLENKNSLHVVKYDSKTRKTTKTIIKLDGSFSKNAVQDSINTLKRTNGTPISLENMTDEMNKLFQ